MDDVTVWNPVNTGIETPPVLGRLEGNQIVVSVASMAVAVMVFQLLGGDGNMGLLPNLTIAASVPCSTVFVIIRFFVGRPPSYFWDFVAWECSHRLFAGRPLISKPEPIDQ